MNAETARQASVGSAGGRPSVQHRHTSPPAPRTATARRLCLAAVSVLGLGAFALALRLPDAQLEDAFWGCDAMATQHATTRDGDRCARFAAELKQRRFGGDADAFHTWHQLGRADAAKRRLTSPLAQDKAS